MKVLIVEDERKVRQFLREALKAAGMNVDAVENQEEAEFCLESNEYDAIVLDRLLKGKDSLDWLKKYRQKNRKGKILVLSALSEVDEKVSGLSAGADDYLGKPFHVSELIARLRAITRRDSPLQQGHCIVSKDLQIDLDTQKVSRNGIKINLTGKEFKVLALLAKYPGKIFSKMMLLDQIWEINSFPESNVIEVTIANLRAKIDKGFTPLIHSRRGIGYWFGDP